MSLWPVEVSDGEETSLNQLNGHYLVSAERESLHNINMCPTLPPHSIPNYKVTCPQKLPQIDVWWLSGDFYVRKWYAFTFVFWQLHA